jgi:hypothetical protein
VFAILLGCVFAASDVRRADGQVDAGYLANWKDREIRVDYNASTNQTSVFLALAPGEGAAQGRPPVLLVFQAQAPGREVLEPPANVIVSAYAGPLSDPRVARPVTMRFSIDEGTDQGLTLPFFGANWGVFSFVPPGADIPVVRFTLTAAEIRALAVARTISGAAIGYEFALSGAQVEAIRAFARSVRLV